MSGSGAKKEKESSSGSGFLSGLLLAGGAAAVGFLAKTVYDDYKEYQAAEESVRNRQFYASGNSSAQLKEDAKVDPAKKDEDLSEATRCIVCMDNVRQVIIEPCGHVCLCKNCARAIVKTRPKCPVCHARIVEIKSCFLP